MSTAVRLVVPNGARVLAAPNGLAGWQLPRVPLAWSAAWQEDDVVTATRIVGAEVAPVRRIDAGAWEMTLRGRVPSTASHWIGLDELGRLGSDERVVRAWLALAEPTVFERASWHDEVEAWVAQVVAPTTAIGRSLRHWELSAVTRIPTEAGPVVAKENRRGFHREGPVLAALHGLPAVPELLALDDARLVTPVVPGTPPSDQDILLRTLGEFHRAAMGRTGALDELWPTPTATEVDAAALETVGSLEVPATVVHCDAHQGNLLVDERGVATLIDWTDAHVANPLLDCRMGLIDREDDAAALDSWLDALGGAVDANRVRSAIPAIALVGSLTLAEFYRRGHADIPASMRDTWRGFEQFWLDRIVDDRARLAPSRP